MNTYQQAVIATYSGKIENKKSVTTFLKNLDSFELFEYKKVEFKGLYEKLNFFSNILYYRKCFNRDTMEVEMVMEEVKYELLILQKELMELNYTIQCMSYEQKEFDFFELNQEQYYQDQQEFSPCETTSICSIVDTESIATTCLEVDSVCSTIIE